MAAADTSSMMRRMRQLAALRCMIAYSRLSTRKRFVRIYAQHAVLLLLTCTLCMCTNVYATCSYILCMYTTQIIYDILGIPAKDRHHLTMLSAVRTSGSATSAEAATASKDLTDYISTLVSFHLYL